VRAAIQPWAVALQVTPLVAIAPLIIIWVNQTFVALVVCATIISFFPILASTAAGLAETPRDLQDLFRLNGASRRQTLFMLLLPSAVPNFLTGLRISGTLALVGAVVAEFVAGSGGFASGLAYRIIEAGYRLEIPRMFAAMALLAVSGVAIYAALGLVSHLVLRRRDH
jgi:NitT/TauT family transport system permease protein